MHSKISSQLPNMKIAPRIQQNVPRENGLNLHQGDLGWISGKNFFTEKLSWAVMAFPSLEGLAAVWMWHLRTWVSGDFGRAGGMVGLDDLGVISQNKLFCDYILSYLLCRGGWWMKNMVLSRWSDGDISFIFDFLKNLARLDPHIVGIAEIQECWSPGVLDFRNSLLCGLIPQPVTKGSPCPRMPGMAEQEATSGTQGPSQGRKSYWEIQKLCSGHWDKDSCSLGTSSQECLKWEISFLKLFP